MLQKLNCVCDPTSLRREEKEYLWAMQPSEGETSLEEQLPKIRQGFQEEYPGRDIDLEALLEFYLKFQRTSDKAKKPKKVAMIR